MTLPELDAEAEELLARARASAQQHKHFECRALDVLWAHTEHEPGPAAKRLRVVCRHGRAALMRPLAELLPLAESLRAALREAADQRLRRRQGRLLRCPQDAVDSFAAWHGGPHRAPRPRRALRRPGQRGPARPASEPRGQRAGGGGSAPAITSTSGAAS